MRNKEMEAVGWARNSAEALRFRSGQHKESGKPAGTDPGPAAGGHPDGTGAGQARLPVVEPGQTVKKGELIRPVRQENVSAGTRRSVLARSLQWNPGPQCGGRGMCEWWK